MLLPGGRTPLAWENALYLSRLEEIFEDNIHAGLAFSKDGAFTRARSCHSRALEAAMKLQSLPKQNLALGNLGNLSLSHNGIVGATTYQHTNAVP